MKKGKYIVFLKYGPWEYPYVFDEPLNAIEFMDTAFEHALPDEHGEVLNISMKKVLEDGNPNTAPED